MSGLRSKLVYSQQATGFRFDAEVREHSFAMDASQEAGGQDSAPNPKEFLLSSLLGCSAMDVVALLRKFRVSFDRFELEASGELTDSHPKRFPQVDVIYAFEGKDLPLESIQKAVTLSMTRYCGVSAMLAQAFPIYYSIRINGEIEARGQAHFDL